MTALLYLVERSDEGVWRVVLRRAWRDHLGEQMRQYGWLWREPASTFRDAFDAYCWQRYPGGPIFYSDPIGGMVGSVQSLETLHAFGFIRAFGEPIENGTDPIELVPSNSQS